MKQDIHNLLEASPKLEVYNNRQVMESRRIVLLLNSHTGYNSTQTSTATYLADFWQSVSAVMPLAIL